MRLDAASCRNELTHALTPQYGCSPQNAAAHGQPGALPYADAGSASNALAKLQRIQMRFCVTAANKSTNPLSASALVSWRFGARSLPRRRFRHTWTRASWPQPTTSAQCSGPTQRSGFKVRGPAVGAVGDHGLVRVRLYCAGLDRRRLATAAVAKRGRQPLRVCSIEPADLISVANDRGGDSRRATDFPIDSEGQVSADVLLSEVMNALRRSIVHGEVESPFAVGLGRSGASDIAGSHQRSPRHQDCRSVVQSGGLAGIRRRICHRAHLDDGAWRACLMAWGASET
jgi:hypothetical protein